VLVALVLVVVVFGWTGGKLLVTQSYVDAKEKVAEQKADRAAKKERRRAELGNGPGLLGRVRRRDASDERDEGG
jgi:hypothetical protein